MSTPVAPSYDPLWDDLYRQGQFLVQYPYDFIVSFVYRNSRTKPRHELRILEIGCGPGNNLWFAAREGFQVVGLDASEVVIDHARQRFAREKLPGEFVVGDFTRLPFPDESFDLVLERGAIVCTGFSSATTAVHEVQRVLKPGGRFLFNPFSSQHSSYTLSQPGPDGIRVQVTGGALRGVGQVCLYAESDLERVVGPGWDWIQKQHVEFADTAEGHEASIQAEWRVVLQKPQVRTAAA